MFFSKIKTMDINSLKENKINKSFVIDVRTTSEHKTNNIPGTKNIPLNKIMVDYEKLLSKDKKYYIYCQSGMRAKKAVKFLDKKGYDVTSLGGIMQYRR